MSWALRSMMALYYTDKLNTIDIISKVKMNIVWICMRIVHFMHIVK